MVTKIQEFVELYKDELFFVFSALVIFSIGFGLGRLTDSEEGSEISGLSVKSSPVSVEELTDAITGKKEVAVEQQIPTSIVGNKNSRVFHLSTCSGARSMAEQNKIFFASIEEAVKAGYRPAANCPGL